MRKIGTGLLDQCSFAFPVIRQSWNDSRTKRTITEVSLDRGDVSVVGYGASPTTSVDARALGAQSTSGNLSLYQARARAAALGVHTSSKGNPLSLYQVRQRARCLARPTMTETELEQLVDLDLAGFLSALDGMSAEDLQQVRGHPVVIYIMYRIMSPAQRGTLLGVRGVLPSPGTNIQSTLEVPMSEKGNRMSVDIAVQATDHSDYIGAVLSGSRWNGQRVPSRQVDRTLLTPNGPDELVGDVGRVLVNIPERRRSTLVARRALNRHVRDAFPSHLHAWSGSGTGQAEGHCIFVHYPGGDPGHTVAGEWAACPEVSLREDQSPQMDKAMLILVTKVVQLPNGAAVRGTALWIGLQRLDKCEWAGPTSRTLNIPLLGAQPLSLRSVILERRKKSALRLNTGN